MDRQWDFFGRSETSLSVFHPLRHIVAGCDSYRDAKAAEASFRASGIGCEHARAVTREFVAKQPGSRTKGNIVDKFANESIKFLGDERCYIAGDKTHAQDGRAFLFVFAPNDEDPKNAKSVFATSHGCSRAAIRVSRPNRLSKIQRHPGQD